jgi:hypothetical protein
MLKEVSCQNINVVLSFLFIEGAMQALAPIQQTTTAQQPTNS